MSPRALRSFAIAATVALSASVWVYPAQSWAFGVLAAESAVLALVAHLFRNDLERVVALRYLRRSQSARFSPDALWACAAGIGLALLGFALSRYLGRTVETMAASSVFIAILVAACFVPIYFFNIFTAVSTIGLALGVSTLVVVLGVTSGFEREFKEKVLSVNGHIVANSYGNPEPEAADRELDAVIEKLSDLPGLTRVEKFSLSAGEVMIGKFGANLKGLDLRRGSQEISAALLPGHRIEDLNEPATCASKPLLPGLAPEVEEDVGRMAIGVQLARKLGVSRGDCVQVLVPFSKGGKLTAPPFTFKVAAIFHLGFNEYDSRLAYVNLEDAHKISGARQTLFGVELRFEDPLEAIRMVPRVEARLGPQFRVTDWRTLNSNLFRALIMQKTVISIILLIKMVVASFNVLASLYLIVRTKVREIAILNSMGTRRRSVMGIFVVAGAFIGLTGGGIGLLLGLAQCAIISRFGYALDPKVYLIEQLPVELNGFELLAVPAAAVAICLLATLYPALKASRLEVVDGLRFD